MSESLVPRLQERAATASSDADQVQPRFYIETYGCQMNTYDSQVIQGRLQAAGFVPVNDHLAADLVLVNTCSVREHAEHRVVSRIGELRHLRQQAALEPAVLGICGCMAERLQEELTRQKHRVDLVIGVDHYDDLPRLAGELVQAAAEARGPAPAPAIAVGHDQAVHYVAPPELYPTNNSHLVTIHKGCDYRCTYCIVPATRGPQSEKPPTLILDEIHRIVAAGGREVTLLGQNVTAYHWQQELDFAGLIQQILAIEDLARLRFLTGHPRDMHPHLMDLIGAEPRICPWLHVPAQSGSDRILRRMKRLYTRAQYQQMVDYARAHIPGVTFSSDIIVGFPGESGADFQQTLELLQDVRFDAIFAFKYSPRPGAPSARLADDVPQVEKERRLAAVHATQEAVWKEMAAAVVGEVWQAVVEGPARRPAGHWRLRTPANRKVVAQLAAPEVGQILTLRITGWHHTTFLGEPV